MAYEGSRGGLFLIYGQFMRLIARSSLSSALRTLSFKAKQRMKRKGIILPTIPGPNCHEKTPTRCESAIFCLKKFKNGELVISNNAIRNSLASRQNNCKSPYSGKEIAYQFTSFSQKIRSTVYCQIDGSYNMYQGQKNNKLTDSQHHQRYHLKTKREKQPGIEKVSKTSSIYYH